MSLTLLGLLVFPLLVVGVAIWKFPRTVTWKECLLQVLIQTAIISGVFCWARHNSMSDTEYLNGRITEKNHGSEKCCHCRQVCDGYRDVCNSRDDKGSCTSTSQECTGYHEECDHFRDYYWSLDSTVGEISIDSCEPDKYRVPPTWAAAYKGEPATVPHTYTNYLKADKESLLVHKDLQKFEVPDFPEVYDFYHVNPILGTAPVPHQWVNALREINATLGFKKQVDIKILTTKVQNPVYAQAVESKWLYGPKNSLTVVLGIQGARITWARVVTFSKVEELKIFLRDELEGKTLTDDIPGIIRVAVETKFHRTAMAEYEYLAQAATPSTGWLIFLYVLGAVLAVGTAVVMHRTDVFGDERGLLFRNRNYRKYR